MRAVSSATQSQPGYAEQVEELAQLTLDEVGPLGDTLAHLDGETVSVFGGIPGEQVVARIIRYRRRRKQHTSALVTEVLKPSPHRVSPPCPYFGPCTGCQWQHIDYSHQLRLKRQAVQRGMRRFEELRDVPISNTMPSPQQFAYRNHARFTIRRQNGTLGFINRITRRFVNVDDCMLMTDSINETLRSLQGRCGETSQLSVRYGINTSDVLIQPELKNDEIPLESGQTHYREELLGRMFRVASPSFFQVNTRQAEQLALLLRSRLELTGSDVLVDAYAGVGTFAVLLAPYVRLAIAVEESGAAVRDAAFNTRGLENIELRQGKTEDTLGALDRPDAVVLDPPRAGCQPEVLEVVARWAPRRTVYVSCDPETMARDLRTLVQGGLKVELVEPVDMFPQTHHVECVATLTSGGRI